MKKALRNNESGFILKGDRLLFIGVISLVSHRLPVTETIFMLPQEPAGRAESVWFQSAETVRIAVDPDRRNGLFSTDVKVPICVGIWRWRQCQWPPVGPMALFACSVRNLPVGAAVLLSAIVASADPVWRPAS